MVSVEPNRLNALHRGGRGGDPAAAQACADPAKSVASLVPHAGMARV